MPGPTSTPTHTIIRPTQDTSKRGHRHRMQKPVGFTSLSSKLLSELTVIASDPGRTMDLATELAPMIVLRTVLGHQPKREPPGRTVSL